MCHGYVILTVFLELCKCFFVSFFLVLFPERDSLKSGFKCLFCSDKGRTKLVEAHPSLEKMPDKQEQVNALVVELIDLFLAITRIVGYYRIVISYVIETNDISIKSQHEISEFFHV